MYIETSGKALLKKVSLKNYYNLISSYEKHKVARLTVNKYNF